MSLTCESMSLSIFFSHSLNVNKRLSVHSSKIADRTAMDLLLAGALASNFVFGVAIVICNKAVVALDGFNFIVVLTLCHFLFTLLACIIMAKGRVFVPKHLPWTKRLCLSSVGAWGRTRRFFIHL